MPARVPPTSAGPTRKFRGKRRYFRQVAARAAAFSLSPGPDSWWDLWHYHADWPGWGGLRWSYRRQHLAALAVVFATIARASARFATPFQSWLVLSTCAGGDATFLHTPNPNRDDFPFAPEGFAWEPLRDAELLALFPAGLALRVGRPLATTDREDVDRGFLVYSPDVGAPLEPAAPLASAASRSSPPDTPPSRPSIGRAPARARAGTPPPRRGP